MLQFKNKTVEITRTNSSCQARQSRGMKNRILIQNKLKQNTAVRLQLRITFATSDKIAVSVFVTDVESIPYIQYMVVPSTALRVWVNHDSAFTNLLKHGIKVTYNEHFYSNWSIITYLRGKFYGINPRRESSQQRKRS